MTPKTLLLTAAGFLLLALGAIGIFLPVWPTTPFVLLAVASFSANPSIQQRILKIPFIDEHMTNYRQRTGLKKRNLAFSLAFLWASLGASALAIKTPGIAAMLLLIGACVTAHLVWISKPKRK